MYTYPHRQNEILSQTVEANVDSLNTGFRTAYHQAQTQQTWEKLVAMPTSTGQARQ